MMSPMTHVMIAVPTTPLEALRIDSSISSYPPFLLGPQKPPSLIGACVLCIGETVAFRCRGGDDNTAEHESR